MEKIGSRKTNPERPLTEVGWLAIDIWRQSFSKVSQLELMNTYTPSKLSSYLYNVDMYLYVDMEPETASKILTFRQNLNRLSPRKNYSDDDTFEQLYEGLITLWQYHQNHPGCKPAQIYQAVGKEVDALALPAAREQRKRIRKRVA